MPTEFLPACLVIVKMTHFRLKTEIENTNLFEYLSYHHYYFSMMPAHLFKCFFLAYIRM